MMAPSLQNREPDAVKQNTNVFIEMVITTQEADRQVVAGLGVAKRNLDDGTEEKVLWAPNGLAVSKPELCYWLEQEHKTRAAV